MNIRLNKYLQPQDSPVTNRPFTDGLTFDGQYEVQQRQVIASKVGITNLIKATVAAQGTANFALSDTIDVSTTVGFNPPFQTKPIFANNYAAFYQGTVLTTAHQIWPARGGSVTPGQYIVQGGYDFHLFDGVVNIWAGCLTNTSGTSSQVVTFIERWIYLDYTVGAAV